MFHVEPENMLILAQSGSVNRLECLSVVANEFNTHRHGRQWNSWIVDDSSFRLHTRRYAHVGAPCLSGMCDDRPLILHLMEIYIFGGYLSVNKLLWEFQKETMDGKNCPPPPQKNRNVFIFIFGGYYLSVNKLLWEFEKETMDFKKSSEKIGKVLFA